MPMSQMGQKSPMACPQTGSARAQWAGHCQRLLLAAASSGGGKPDIAGLRVSGCLFAANGVGRGKPNAAAP